MVVVPKADRNLIDYWPVVSAITALTFAAAVMALSDDPVRRWVVLGLVVLAAGLFAGAAVNQQSRRWRSSLLGASLIALSLSLVAVVNPGGSRAPGPTLEMTVMRADDFAGSFIVPVAFPLEDVPGIDGGICTETTMTWLHEHATEVVLPIITIRNLALDGPLTHIEDITFTASNRSPRAPGYVYTCPNAGMDEQIDVFINADTGVVRMSAEDKIRPFGATLAPGEAVQLAVILEGGGEEVVSGLLSIDAQTGSNSETLPLPWIGGDLVTYVGKRGYPLEVIPGSAPGSYYCERENEMQPCSAEQIRSWAG